MGSHWDRRPQRAYERRYWDLLDVLTHHADEHHILDLRGCHLPVSSLDDYAFARPFAWWPTVGLWGATVVDPDKFPGFSESHIIEQLEDEWPSVDLTLDPCLTLNQQCQSRWVPPFKVTLQPPFKGTCKGDWQLV